MCNQGFLKLSVLLYVDQSNSTENFIRTDNGYAQEYTLETSGATGHPPSLNVGNMVKLGQVEISDEASLEDLKTQVECDGHFLHPHQQLGRIKIGDLLYCVCQMLTLPGLQNVCVPSAAFMRVWQLEGQRLARILRGKQHTLRFYHRRCAIFFLCNRQKLWLMAWQCVFPLIRKLKLSTGTDLCVQQLVKDEDLG